VAESQAANISEEDWSAFSKERMGEHFQRHMGGITRARDRLAQEFDAERPAILDRFVAQEQRQGDIMSRMMSTSGGIIPSPDRKGQE